MPSLRAVVIAVGILVLIALLWTTIVYSQQPTNKARVVFKGVSTLVDRTIYEDVDVQTQYDKINQITLLPLIIDLAKLGDRHNNEVFARYRVEIYDFTGVKIYPRD